MRDPHLETSGKIIGFYEREFYCFSNFSSFAVEWKGCLWQTSEHAYQAAKFMDKHPEIADQIFNAKSAHDAQKIAKKYKDKRPVGWSRRKVSVMEEICLNKLQQHPYIQKKLLQTGDKQIVEDSPDDDFWGWGSKRDGRDEMGRIWMKLRKNNLKI
ncbi:NADAR family protein [Patescibacteria group bacterium AH-259-L07]|nr:NADAR family protein [Patescibacteria group bacterium AH-259-L07]